MQKLLLGIWLGALLVLVACDTWSPGLFGSPAIPLPAARLTSETVSPLASATPLPRAQTTPALATVIVRTRVVTPPAPFVASMGMVKRAEMVNNQLQFQITPDDPAMRSEFVIADWSSITVWYYRVGQQTPTPIAADSKLALAKDSVGRRVTIGYYATTPPTIVLLSIHKKPGEPQ